MSSSDPEHDGAPDTGAEHSSDPQEPTPLDIDSAFAAIVAGWGDDLPTAGGWPADDDGGRREPGSSAPVADEGAPPAGAGPLRPPIGLPDADDLDDPVLEEFIPPDPPPLPRGDTVTMLAWAGVIAGPVFLIVAVIAWRSAPEPLVLAAIGAFVAGFVALVSRMPKHRDDDDDDGAVI